MHLLTLGIALLLWTDPIGSALSDGVHLVYESGGASQSPWIYDSVRVVANESFDRCIVVTRRGQTSRESCVRGDTLFERRAAGEYAAARPIGPDMELEVETASGDIMRYVTGSTDLRTISGEDVKYLSTTITTHAKDGTVKRRLREHYAPSLLTALWGVFEVPESADEWKIVQEFSLAEISR